MRGRVAVARGGWITVWSRRWERRMVGKIVRQSRRNRGTYGYGVERRNGFRDS